MFLFVVQWFVCVFKSMYLKGNFKEKIKIMEVIKGYLVDVVSRTKYGAEISVENGFIKDIVRTNDYPDAIIMPGFVDAHIHIESSMVVPSEFARMAVKWGTVATVSDPHEIANVLGVDGVNYMKDSGKQVNFKFHFGVPSCVPATDFEASGARLDAAEVDRLLAQDDYLYLSEMMNYPGVVFGDKNVQDKLLAAKKYNKPVDGHAPNLTGDMLRKYAAAGITTDHECSTLDEAVEKIKLGMKILIREGSAAKNFEALVNLYQKYPADVMLCSDDLHPDDLLNGHINLQVKRALAKGFDLFDVLRSVSYNPVKFYGLKVGLLQVGDPADFIIVDNLQNFNVQTSYINGEKVYENNTVLLAKPAIEPVNKFYKNTLSLSDLVVEVKSGKLKVIQATEGDLLTSKLLVEPPVEKGRVVADVERDILKIAVLNRYAEAKPALGFIKGFQLKRGALASTVAHDSHNIVAVGTNDTDLLRAIELIQLNKGALVAVNESDELVLPLDVAGIMSSLNGEEVGHLYENLNKKAAEYGAVLKAPFMTLAFMSLLVIPSLKLGDKGLFDGDKFEFTDLFEV
jgi:adenine deaminase